MGIQKYIVQSIFLKFLFSKRGEFIFEFFGRQAREMHLKKKLSNMRISGEFHPMLRMCHQTGFFVQCNIMGQNKIKKVIWELTVSGRTN